MKYQIINIEHFLGEGFICCMSIALRSRNCLLFSVCLTIYTSAGLSHTERDGVGVKGSLETGMTASLPLLYRVDRLLSQQHQWWKIDDMALLLLKPTKEATKSNCHIIFYIDGKHLPTVQCRASEGEWLSASFLCVGIVVLYASYFNLFLTVLWLLRHYQTRSWYGLRFVLNMLLSLVSCLRL